MEFKKIDDRKFQCLLYEEDMEDNNISLDDFFRNDTNKIHSLLDVVMQEAEKSIGVMMNGGVMSLQLAPQPNHSLLLTISSGTEDFGSILKHAGEQAIKAISDEESNVIKKGDGVDATDAIFSNMVPDSLKSDAWQGGSKSNDFKEDSRKKSTDSDVSNNYIKAAKAVFKLKSMAEVEEFCNYCPKTWGVTNSLYKDNSDGALYLILEKGRGSEKRYKELNNIIVEYGDFISSKEERIAYIKEHYEVYIGANAINIIKRICE